MGTMGDDPSHRARRELRVEYHRSPQARRSPRPRHRAHPHPTSTRLASARGSRKYHRRRILPRIRTSGSCRELRLCRLANGNFLGSQSEGRSSHHPPRNREIQPHAIRIRDPRQWRNPRLRPRRRRTLETRQEPRARHLKRLPQKTLPNRTLLGPRTLQTRTRCHPLLAKSRTIPRPRNRSTLDRDPFTRPRDRGALRPRCPTRRAMGLPLRHRLRQDILPRTRNRQPRLKPSHRNPTAPLHRSPSRRLHLPME